MPLQPISAPVYIWHCYTTANSVYWHCIALPVWSMWPFLYPSGINNTCNLVLLITCPLFTPVKVMVRFCKCKIISSCYGSFGVRYVSGETRNCFILQDGRWTWWLCLLIKHWGATLHTGELVKFSQRCHQ